MSTYDTLLSSLCEIAASVQALQHQAVEEYTPVVEAILRSRSRDVRHIERTLDGLLDVCCHEPALLLYRRLCRHYFKINPAATVRYVQAYREMWDSEEISGSAEHPLGTKAAEVAKTAELVLGVPGEKPPEPEPGAPAKTDHPGWTSRGYLPHRDEIGLIQSVTFRLADSLPQDKLRQLERELALRPKAQQDPERRKRLESWLDAGIGCCALAHPEVAETLENTLLRFDGQRYRLLAWCIMPTHVHTLIEPTAPLAAIVKSWKSYSGRWALAHNAELRLGIPGKAFWMREYWDRFIRDGKHLRQAIDYIQKNPVKAGLCATPAAWPWSSARFPPEE